MIRLFNVYYPVRTLVLLIGEALIVGASLLLGAFFELRENTYHVPVSYTHLSIMDLPLLISVPWLGGDDDNADGQSNGHRRFWGRGGPPSPKEHENVEV